MVEQATRVKTHGKFFFEGGRKFFLKAVTYGPFRARTHGHPFPEAEQVAEDFRLMKALGVNGIRTYNPPPPWLMGLAESEDIRVMVGIPWAQHITFLDSQCVKDQIRAGVRSAVEQCRPFRSTFCYLIGNEIPADIIRWHGPRKIQNFLMNLCTIVRELDPEALVSYANFPSTEYLELDFLDFLCFNVYLHHQEDFQKYLARLQNLAGRRPLLLSEFGADSIREGEEEQARILDQKLSTSFRMGAAGTVIFAWTDEWFTGGHAITDWAFGLVNAERRPKQAFEVVHRHYGEALPPLPEICPKVSVVVCAYNAERTIETCLQALQNVHYPDLEIIVVNDGSTDRTEKICRRYPFIKLICQKNKGLSVARNVGLDAATGSIIAYTDSDCDVDPDWITYLVHSFAITGKVAIGGPNLPPPEDARIPACVAVSPGGPTHVLIDDLEAEHIAGCNMAFRRDVLRTLGGFDAQYRAAGDDVDICWRLQDEGHSIGFSPAAQVWHFRRNTVRDYFKQQQGYGKAEAMVYFKHPERFNLLGQARWLGRIYGDMATSMLPSKPFIYSGVFGMAPFQSLYQAPASLWSYLPLTLEWNLAGLLLLVFLLLFGGNPLIGFIPLAITVTASLVNSWKAPVDPRYRSLPCRLLIAYMILGGPLVRSIERYKWRSRILRLGDRSGLPRPRSNLKVPPFRSTIHINFWSDSGSDRDILLKDIIHQLQESKYFVNIQDGWTDWDFSVQQGLWSYARVQSCTENHGGCQRLLRLRVHRRLSGLSKVLGAAWVGLVLIVMATGQLVTGWILALAGLALATVITCQVVKLTRALVLVLNLSADRLSLLPLESQGRRPNGPERETAANSSQSALEGVL